MFAVLGTIEFDALGSPEGIQRDRAMTFAEHKVVEGTPRLQQIGAGLDRLELDLLFHVSFTTPRAQRDALYAALDAARALALVWGNGEHWGYYVIESASETQRWLATDGNPIALAMRVQLKTWALDSEFDPLAPPTPATPPLALVKLGELAPGQSVAGTVLTNPETGAQIVVFAKPITGASALVNNPPSSAPGNTTASDVSTSAIVRADGEA